MSNLPLENLLTAEAEFLASALKVQSRALELLLAEMRALGAILPGQPPRPPDTGAEPEIEIDALPL